MARELDYFPTYDPLVRDEIYLSNIWGDFMATFVESLREYLSENGIFAPRITTLARDSLINPVNGQLIYNTTANKFQGFENGAWVNLV